MSVQCQSCGNMVEDGVKFCRFCGSPIAQPQAYDPNAMNYGQPQAYDPNAMNYGQPQAYGSNAMNYG